ncbi:bromodomain adjacent to zinc finger domain protein 1A isoform X2 [Chrysoperla carnea]|uniref:bromodomain adjacent to zinc finger domain protein 1A isoform X2 n=1 Tax=Chrysoperla carnea TaxID=189513 RepID=UPI001D0805BD|nr:bromodomain adjacent to zinc finger domain protein 1A isoform X2 [Chrysoperla carnea]
MPLLKRKAFEKAKVPEYLRDDEEVFHCEVTNEIFRDYEEFCERMILVNSMVWTCSMTGRNNLTYAEALESEENARKSLRDFPPTLRVPLLYLASKTHRDNFTDMAEDVWKFARDRFFVGEIVDALLSDGAWHEGQILQVMAPSDEAVAEYQKKGVPSLDPFIPQAVLYRYEIEQTADDNQIFIVDAANVRRKKSIYTRDKSKIFVRQFTEPSRNDNIWRVKEALYQKYHINKVTFDQIFDGPLPDFSNSKKSRPKKQETLTKFFTKGGSSNQKSDGQNANNKTLLENMKKRQQEMKAKAAADKARTQIEKQNARKRKREEDSEKAALMREWIKPRDDLELEDHKILPIPTPVETKITSTYFGDALMILEFVNVFSSVLSTKKYFVTGLTLSILERCLFTREVNGPLTDLLKLLLNALFNMQNDEAAEIKNVKNPQIQENMQDAKGSEVTVAQAIRQATSAAHWCKLHQGFNLSQMPLDGLTITEVLRLHLLSSGSKMTESTARWQFQQRGGYTSEDDPGLYFRMVNPHIIHNLTTHHVSELSLGDKIKILTCLIDQISTYADVRDIIEEQLEKARQAKFNLKLLQQAERKHENEVKSQRFKIKQDYRKRKIDTPDQSQQIDREEEIEMEKLDKDFQRKQDDFQKQAKELSESSNITLLYTPYLGTDRAYRRYIFSQTIGALFVEHDEGNPGSCMDRVIIPNPSLIDATQDDTLKYIRELFSEKPTDSTFIFRIPSPRKSGASDKPSEETIKLKNLLMCTGIASDCPVHSNSVDRVKWSFFHKPEDLDALTQSLNKRGVRESELRLTLEGCKEYIKEICAERCKPEKLAPSAYQIDENRVRRAWRSRYDNANLGYDDTHTISDILELTLRDYILDLEQQVYSGGLGTLQVKDRTLWRMCLKDRNYDVNHLKFIASKPNGVNTLKVKVEEVNGNGESRASTPEVEDVIYIPKLDIDDDEKTANQKAITGLAVAMEALAFSINEKYMNRPLGEANEYKKNKPETKRKGLCNRWAASLMLATSFPQLLIHYSTLESCVALNKSALNACCVTCRKRTNDDQLLLCDGCNRGQHLYCIEPKLTSVPTGDWFCDRCKPVETTRVRRRSRKRKIFSEESDEDTPLKDRQENGHTNGNNVDEESENEEENGTSTEANESMLEVCEVCKEGGRVICCDSCSIMYHPECLDPPLRRVPRGTWHCSDCKRKQASDGAKKVRAQRLEKRSRDSNSDSDENHSEEDSENDNEDEDDDDNGYSSKAKRRSRRANDLSDDLPLHNAPLQELLSEILKHPDAWPFTQPVQKRDVPDYFDVITHPMDFGTIKYKLNMGKYQYDDELMHDAILVFENCNTYNDSEADVYKCGVKLLKFFKQKAQELGLRVPQIESGMMDDAEEIEDENNEERQIVKTKIPRKKARFSN